MLIQRQSIWFVAIVTSVIAHMALASVFTSSDEDAKIAGGSDVNITVLGHGNVDTIMAGELTSEENTDDFTEETSPEITTETEKTELLPEVVAESIPILEPINEFSKDIAADQIIEDESINELAPPLPSEEVAQSSPIDEIAPTAPKKEILPSTQTEIQTSLSELELAALPIPNNLTNSVPVPQLRPEETTEITGKPVEKKKTKKKATSTKPPKKVKTKKPPKKASSGNKGKADANRKKGTKDAKSNKSSLASKGKAKSKQAGNASLSNYKGKLRNRITRRFKPGRAKPGNRDAVVSFIVIASGQAKSIRLARSSGNKKLDAAALKAVQRSSPFPPLPSGKTKLSVTVPLAVRR